MYRDKGGQIFGVLNDFDLATMLDDPRTGPSLNHPRGTLPLMAHEQHATSWDGRLYHRHDLKSLFYVMLFLACHYSAPGVRARTLSYGSRYHTESPNLGMKKLVSITDISQTWSPPICIRPFFLGFQP